MSESITFTIAGGEDAKKIKEIIRTKAQEKGISVSEWIVDACVDKIRREKNP